MKGLKLDVEHGIIIVGMAFSKKCADPSSQEYKALKELRFENPDFEIQFHHIRRNAQKETYRGLTYAYMDKYIRKHESKETVQEVLDEFEELRLISQCHGTGRRYPTIKKWFLDKYPAVAKFGTELADDMDALEEAGCSETDTAEETPVEIVEKKQLQDEVDPAA